MIAREEARLRSLFHRLLAVAVVATPACSSSSSTDSGNDASSNAPADATADTTIGNEHDSSAPGVDGGGGGDDSSTPVQDAACASDFLDGADDGNGCEYFEKIPCGLPSSQQVENCFLPITQCQTLCNQTTGHNCYIVECLDIDSGGDASYTPPSGPLTIECKTGNTGCAPGAGRRPEGLREARPIARDAIGAWLAEVAHLEAASVHAFVRVAGELADMDAPRSLVRAAERSARDEVRHARVMSRLARRRGAVPARVAIDRPSRRRSLEAFAIENAVEGCVRECFGALIATHQAEHARDPELATALKRIARDETRHAALAWSIAKWLAPRLDAAARDRVRRAMEGALASLRCEVAHAPPDGAADLGIPSGDAARSLVDAFAAALAA